MQLSRTRLAPFWYTPPDQHDENGAELPDEDKVRFFVKPLTQPQVAELDSRISSTSEAANIEVMYRAGCMALDGGGKIEGILVDGKPARWPIDRDVIPYLLLVRVGAHVYGAATLTEDQEKN